MDIAPDQPSTHQYTQESCQIRINQVKVLKEKIFACTVFLRLCDGFLSSETIDLDLSCKTDLDLWDCLGMGKIGIIARFNRTDLVI